MENDSWKIKRKNTFTERLSPNFNKKKTIRKEFFSFMKNNDKVNSKKVIDFPLHLTLFVKSKEKNESDTNRTAKKYPKNKFNFKLSSFKPKELSFNIKTIKSLKEKNIRSRNLDLSGSLNSNNIFNMDSFNSFNTGKTLNINKFLDSIKSQRFKLKSLNYTPLNINTKNSPIIINQIGFDNSSTTKLSSKGHNLSNNSMDNEISFIKNMRNSNKNLTKYNMSINERKIPPIFPSSSPNKTKKNFFNRNNSKKWQLKEIKKILQKEIKNFDLDRNNNKNINKENDINKNKNGINNNKINNNINVNNDFKISKKNFNFKLKNLENSRHNSVGLINLKNSFEFNNKNENNNVQEKKDNLNNDIKGINNIKNSFSIIKKDKKKLSLDLSNIFQNKLEKNKVPIKDKSTKIEVKIEQKKEEDNNENSENNENNNDNNNDNINKRPPSKRKKTEKKRTFQRLRSKNATTKKLTRRKIKLLTHNFYSLKLENSNQNKFLNQYNDNIYITEQQNKKISYEKSRLLLNMQLKTKNYINSNKRRNLLDFEEELLGKRDIDSIRETYFKEITKEKTNKIIYYKSILKKNQYMKINKNFNVSAILSKYILSSHEFTGLSSSDLNLKRRKGILFGQAKENGDNASIIQEQILIKREETFKRSKTQIFQHNNINKDENKWMKTSKNMMRIQEITYKAINYEFLKNDKRVKFRRISTMNNEIKEINKEKLSKKNVIPNKPLAKASTISPLLLKKKKSLKIAYKNRESHSNYSILELKNFFTRNKQKINEDKEIEDLSKEERIFTPLNENAFRIFSSSDISNFTFEEYYYILLNCINKGLNKNFINVFQNMQKKYDINQQIYEGNTLLIFSAKEGNLQITKYLCAQGADVNIQNDSGNTALHYAIANQYFSIVDVLKNNGAKEDILNDKGCTPWDCKEHEL